VLAPSIRRKYNMIFERGESNACTFPAATGHGDKSGNKKENKKMQKTLHQNAHYKTEKTRKV
jgi:hypothetical protein